MRTWLLSTLEAIRRTVDGALDQRRRRLPTAGRHPPIFAADHGGRKPIAQDKEIQHQASGVAVAIYERMNRGQAMMGKGCAADRMQRPGCAFLPSRRAKRRDSSKSFLYQYRTLGHCTSDTESQQKGQIRVLAGHAGTTACAPG